MLGKKILAVVILMFTFSLSAYALSEGDLSAKSAIIVNCDTLETVFQKNAYEKRSMASTTKIMTGLLACESERLSETVNVTAEMCGAEGTSIGLKAGYKINLYDLVCAMMLESGNDAANAVAIFLAGSKEKFAVMMNERAKEIGMDNTSFVTPSGLDDENHYTTAYDMALLGVYAMKNQMLKEICGTKAKKVDFIKPDITMTYSNHNRLLRAYEGTYGIKTGFTKKSGRCLVSACERDGADFVCVTLSAGDDWNDHKKMFGYAFDTVKKNEVQLCIPQTVEVKGGYLDRVKIKAIENSIALSQSGNGEITQRVFLPKFIYAPLRIGDVLGRVNIYYNGRLLKKVDLTVGEDCDAVEPTYVKKFSLIDYIRSLFCRQ